MGNNKEWIKETIGHKAGGGVPYNFMFSPPAEKILLEHYGISSRVSLVKMADIFLSQVLLFNLMCRWRIFWR